MNSFWLDRRVLVTGATGLLGSELVRRLDSQGTNVTILLRDWVGKSRLLTSESSKTINIVDGELEDFETVKRAVVEYEIDFLYHLGAQTIVKTALTSPLGTFKANIQGTWNVLEACRQFDQVDAIIIASSDKAYGAADTLPYTEETPLRGSYPYEVSKSCADLLAQAYFKTYGLPVCIARCGNLFGPGDLNFNRIVPGTIKSVILDQKPIIRSDGTYVRDYLYVSDAANAYLLLGKCSQTENIQGEAFNFSLEKPKSVLEIVEMIIRLMNSNLKPVIQNKVTNEIKAQFLSSAKAQRILGWKPMHGLENALELTIQWYKEYFRG